MTVQSTVPFRKDYEANGTTNVFAYPFQIYDAADLTVYLNGTVKTLNTDYTVSDVGNANGGNITFTMTDSNDDPVDIADGDKISFVMDMDLDRTTNYQPSGAFLAADVNDDFDRLWLATNQQAQEIDRSLRLKADDITTSNMEIPAKDDRKGKLLGFNATTGDPEVSDNNKDNWNAAYNDKINSASFSGSTLTLTQQDGGTVTASHTPYLPIAGGSVTGDIDFGSSKAIFGTNDDLQIYNFLGASIIKEAGSGNLELRATDLILKDDSGGKYAQFTEDGDAKLFYDNDEKLATTSTGINVTGTVEFDGLTGTGSVTVTDILDEDNMASDSATALATQQSIKAYIDSNSDASQWTTSGNDIYYNSGLVGIGMTSPQNTLDIKGTGGSTSGFAVRNSNEIVKGYFANDNADSDFTLTYVGSSSAEVKLRHSGAVILCESAGNVGIGTNNPDRLLHIRGDDIPASLQLERSTTELGAGAPIGIIEFKSNDASTGSSGVVGKIDVRAEDSSPDTRMAFYTHDNDSGTGTLTEQMRITSNGYVGIKKGGSNPTTELDVNGTVTAVDLNTSGQIISQRTDNNAGLVLKSSDTDATSGPVANFVRNNAEAGATGDALGHIRFMGQDSNSESQRYASITAQIEDPTNGAHYGGLDIGIADNSGMRNRFAIKHLNGQSTVIINESGDDVDFRVESDTNQNALFLRGSDGNVGIGTGSPSTALDVSGTVTATGLVAGGNTYPTSQGTNGQVIVTDGNGTLSFADQSGGGGGGDVVDDTSPQLGGDLDTNDKAILLGDANLAETQNIIKFGAGNDMRIFSDGNQGRIEGQIHVNGNVSGSVMGKLVSTTLGDTPEERWLRFILVKATSGASKYYHFRVKGYVNSEAIESHVDYDVYLHVRDDSDSTNAYDLDVTGYEVGDGSLQIGMKPLSTQNEFYVKIPEDYSAVEVYNLADDTSEDLKDLISTTTTTDPTGITYATPKIHAFNNDTIEFADGSHAAPSITFANDTDTGISSSIANTLDFSVGGNDRMRLNSSGNLLVGTTSAGSLGSKIRAAGRIESSSGFAATSNGSNFEQSGNYGGAGLTLDGYTTSTTATQKMIALRTSANSEKGNIQIKGNHVLFGCASGNFLLGASTAHTPTAKLDVDGDTIRLRSDRTPASATDTGNKGDICYDSDYMYVCVATNTWKRIALATW